MSRATAMGAGLGLVLLAAGELHTPLYLAPGQYRLRLTGPDDTVLADRTLDVPAHRPSPSDTP